MSGNEEISVQPGGITIGWRLMVGLGALVLGYYVATQVAPISNELRAAQSDVRRLEQESDKQAAKLEALEDMNVTLQVRIAEMGAKLDRLSKPELRANN